MICCLNDTKLAEQILGLSVRSHPEQDPPVKIYINLKDRFAGQILFIFERANRPYKVFWHAHLI